MAEKTVLEAVTIAVAAADLLGEKLAKASSQELLDMEDRAPLELAELYENFESSAAAAVAVLREVHTHAWWERADPHTIGHAYMTARAWKDFEPAAAEAEATMRVELRRRYGIDVESTYGKAQEIQDQYEKLELGRLMAKFKQKKDVQEPGQAEGGEPQA
ncbi:hypothetical protein [Sinomonas sp. P47F7]|uniref:hypothetical protein n=1 Tax=Sinomonas sp. P47F7 TaxID=3410987 RepID=UPI003BF51256